MNSRCGHPEVELWAAVIKLAEQDLNGNNALHRSSAQAFFKGKWFRHICHLINANPDYILKKIRQTGGKTCCRKR